VRYATLSTCCSQVPNTSWTTMKIKTTTVTIKMNLTSLTNKEGREQNLFGIACLGIPGLARLLGSSRKTVCRSLPLNQAFQSCPSPKLLERGQTGIAFLSTSARRLTVTAADGGSARCGILTLLCSLQLSQSTSNNTLYAIHMSLLASAASDIVIQVCELRLVNFSSFVVTCSRVRDMYNIYMVYM
jgi:hypothetical protein